MTKTLKSPKGDLRQQLEFFIHNQFSYYQYMTEGTNQAITKPIINIIKEWLTQKRQESQPDYLKAINHKFEDEFLDGWNVGYHRAIEILLAELNNTEEKP